MEIVGSVIGCIAFALVVICLIKCCCRRNRGQVLQPPPSIPPVPPGPNNVVQIVQRTYVPVHPGSAPPGQHTTVVVPATPAPYPQQTYPPAPYPQTSPYPHPAPYPQQTPYPQQSPYPHGMPQPHTSPYPPNAPDASALPPTYEQVMGPADSTPHAKQPPYNPYLSH